MSAIMSFLDFGIAAGLGSAATLIQPLSTGIHHWPTTGQAASVPVASATKRSQRKGAAVR
ncbi:MAG: hypothetical protein VR70_12525 [Rhodospirillaceae bacterium BRH_c57]|nr:MAG: hypothetical protein VR70_12525 [Rhodospirillaceae bacterium BRH_c57]